MKWHLVVALIYIFLISNETDFLVIYMFIHYLDFFCKVSVQVHCSFFFCRIICLIAIMTKEGKHERMC